MEKIKRLLLILILTAILTVIGCSQEQQRELTWEELTEQFECPKWFMEARFGIWAHWGK